VPTCGAVVCDVDPGVCTGPIPDCAAPPLGCDYVDGGCVNGEWTCGRLECHDVGCDVLCQAPPEGCHYELPPPGECSCGTLVCDVDPGVCTGPIPDCAAPPEGCDYVGGGCVDGNWTCGQLECHAVGCDIDCEAPPDGCFYEPPAYGECSCGTLVCDPGPSECLRNPDCPAPPEGCTYVGAGCMRGEWTCGTLECTGVIVY
jgi:hypothetical protein